MYINIKLWYEAMLSEMKSHNRNGTLSLADLPEGDKAINSQCVYAIQRNSKQDLWLKVIAKDLKQTTMKPFPQWEGIQRFA